MAGLEEGQLDEIVAGFGFWIRLAGVVHWLLRAGAAAGLGTGSRAAKQISDACDLLLEVQFLKFETFERSFENRGIYISRPHLGIPSRSAA